MGIILQYNDVYPGMHMNIVDQHDELMAWVQNHYGTYNAWYEHIRKIICINSDIQLFDQYSDLGKQECLDRIESYKDTIQQFSEYLHPWSYSIVSRQVKIDLLNHRISAICTQERMLQDIEKSKKKVVINKDLSISRV